MSGQAARLLALSAQAREAGNSDLAELLAQAAANCLANIVKDERDDSPPPYAAPPHAAQSKQQPAAQQQQQIQPEKNEDEPGS